MIYNLHFNEEKTFVRKSLLVFLVVVMALPYQILCVQIQPIVTFLLLIYLVLKIFRYDIKVLDSYLCLFNIFLFLTFYSSLVSLIYFTPDNIVKLASGLHNHIFLLLIMLVLSSTPMSKVDLQQEITFISKLLAVLILINFITQVMQIVVPNLSREILLFFNSSFTTDKQTFELAQQLGRYSGFLNVSIVSGYFSMVAFLFLIHQFFKVSYFFKLLLVIIFFSGFLTLSKIFIFGMIISVVLLLIFRQVKILTFISLIGLLSLLLVLFMSQTTYMAKFIAYFQFIFDADLNTHLGYRYGSSSYNSSLFQNTSITELLFGQGFPIMKSIDSGVLWYILQGGIVGVLCIFLFFIIWFIQIRRCPDKHDYIFIFLCYLITCVAFLADPINIMRRSSALFAIVVYYTVHLSKSRLNSTTVSYYKNNVEGEVSGVAWQG